MESSISVPFWLKSAPFLVFFALLVKYHTHALHVLDLSFITVKMIKSNGKAVVIANFV